MGFFDSKWVVTFEYSNGILSSNKTGSIVVEASSEYSAKDKAKSVLKGSYKYVKVLSAVKADSKGRPIVSPAPVTITEERSSYVPNPTPTPTRELTPEEREERRLRRIAEEAELERQRKERAIVLKEKQIKKAQTSPIRNCILSGIISLVAFFFGWIPHWVGLAKARASRNALDMWIELGHSKTDSYGQELVADIERYSNEANSVLWIPFVILGIGIVISVIVYILSKKKVPQKVVKLEEELKKLKG
jgi:hypothetical protein